MERQWLELFERTLGSCTLLVNLATVFEHARERAKNGSTPFTL